MPTTPDLLTAERHGVVCSNAAWILGTHIRRCGRGYLCVNPPGADLFLFDEPRRYDELNPKYTNQVPRLVVEVLSPGDRWSKVTRRITEFMRRGTVMVWLVDPEDCTVTIHRKDQFPLVVEENDELNADPLLPGFKCGVKDFFFMPGQ